MSTDSHDLQTPSASRRVLILLGASGARVFRRGAEPVELGDGADLSALLR